jgi:aminoglycoside phosphotransferase (APT) family kinase protein
MRDREQLEALVARALGHEPPSIEVAERPLRGGIDGASVVELVARFVDARGRRGILRVVAKHLRGAAVREAAVYERLLSRHAPAVAPPLLATVASEGEVVLYMTAMPRRAAWPWRDARRVEGVLRTTAALHAAPAAADVPPWDYEAELTRRAGEASAAAARARLVPETAFVGGSLASLRRLVDALPAWRRALLAGPLAPCAIHGDLHSGNVVAGGGSAPAVTLLDWGRARVGSPLEDVCSWLQSLAFWEPVVRQRHDTLLHAYLDARGVRGFASTAVRESYWLAGASNALSGALAYHLGIATTAGLPAGTRARSLAAARDWLRILRRADAVWARRRSQRARPEPRPSAATSPALVAT